MRFSARLYRENQSSPRSFHRRSSFKTLLRVHREGAKSMALDVADFHSVNWWRRASLSALSDIHAYALHICVRARRNESSFRINRNFPTSPLFEIFSGQLCAVAFANRLLVSPRNYSFASWFHSRVSVCRRHCHPYTRLFNYDSDRN